MFESLVANLGGELLNSVFSFYRIAETEPPLNVFAREFVPTNFQVSVNNVRKGTTIDRSETRKRLFVISTLGNKELTHSLPLF